MEMKMEMSISSIKHESPKPVNNIINLFATIDKIRDCVYIFAGTLFQTLCILKIKPMLTIK